MMPKVKRPERNHRHDCQWVQVHGKTHDERLEDVAVERSNDHSQSHD